MRGLGVIDHHHARILGMLVERPRRLKDFTDGEVTLQVSARHVQAWLDEMAADGLVRHMRSEEYRITEAGRAKLREKPSIAAPRDNAASGTYRGPTWNIRPGGEAHKRHRSLGIDGRSLISTDEVES
jgi:DNA-binding PadR family transcriptional regulator